MRTLWRGTLSLGLVTIPVGLYTAVEDRSPSFNQLRASDHARIGYKRVAKVDGQEVDHDDIVKGYEYERDRYVVFDPDELSTLKPKSSRMVEIQQFVPLEQIDPIYFDRAYYLAPEPAGAKAYALLAEAMTDRNTVAICTITLRDKEHLATLRLRDGIFVLETMHWPDEVRAFSLSEVGIDEVPEPREQEVKMAHTLIESLTEDFDPDAFHDAYRERILEAVQAKVSGEEITVVEAAEPATVVDLMDALKRSVEESKKRKGGSAQAAS
ncbi:MAG: Ku protein [Egibacteraceae bacterium]